MLCYLFASNYNLSCSTRILHENGYFKPRPNDRNISKQYIAALLTSICKSRLNDRIIWTQHCWAQPFASRGRLATLLQGVATCWVLKIKQVRMPWRNIVSRTWPNEYNLKPPPNDHNISTQHIATLLSAICCARLATLLRRVVCICCRML